MNGMMIDSMHPHTDRDIYNGSWDEAPPSYSSSLSSAAAGNLSLRFHSHSERDCHIGDFLALSTGDDDDDDDEDTATAAA